ncbi:hypothetical protein L6164_023229 [Bauhinia variegata]|uniref:Uncharacterized protein n=1 Tax=Bauhinia variegata TaxID=167791 RepID=A0ACB9MHJ7_BAUVA|nr:hypothetical protein L6164_023229 [Bauhinia variegata]
MTEDGANVVTAEIAAVHGGCGGVPYGGVPKPLAVIVCIGQELQQKVVEVGLIKGVISGGELGGIVTKVVVII